MELPITKDQADYLNAVARVARLYRVTNERMQRDLQDNLERVNRGLTPSAVRHQDVADILMTAGQLDALCSTAYSVFLWPNEDDRNAFKAHANKVQEYLQAAILLDSMDYILMKH